MNNLGGGNYELEAQKGAVPTDLVAGDYLAVRINKKSGLETELISNTIIIEG